jgi:hypothetical protein
MGKEEEGVDKPKLGKGICPGTCGGLTVARGGLTARHTKSGGQTGCLGRLDRLLPTLQLELLCSEIIQDFE